VRHWLPILAAIVWLSAPARAEPLVADLTSHLIAITTGFTGTEVVLFGAVDGEGDVVVVVRGPDMATTVRRKQRMLGLWINHREVTFLAAPSFYAVASNRPLAEVMKPDVQVRNHIGIENINLQTTKPVAATDRAEFIDALIKEKRRNGLYPEEFGHVSFLGNKLFRATLSFPASVPTGSYQIAIYLLRDGVIVGAQTTPLLVSPFGVNADVVEFAYTRPLAYGIIAVTIAVVAGWAASLAFRRV
jgi:uncharacterized protein (TIGR02186 family)